MKLRNFMIAAFLLIVLAFSSNGVFAKEDNSNVISHGRIVYANGTINNPADDVVIYDSDDLLSLEEKITELQTKLLTVKEKLN